MLWEYTTIVYSRDDVIAVGQLNFKVHEIIRIKPTIVREKMAHGRPERVRQTVGGGEASDAMERPTRSQATTTQDL